MMTQLAEQCALACSNRTARVLAMLCASAALDGRDGPELDEIAAACRRERVPPDDVLPWFGWLRAEHQGGGWNHVVRGPARGVRPPCTSDGRLGLACYLEFHRLPPLGQRLLS